MHLHTDTDPTSVLSTEPMDWFSGKLEWGRVLRAWMPEGFQSYARLLHPAYARVRKGQEVVAEVAVPWSAVSEWSGKSLHATSSIHDLMRRSDGLNWYQREGGGNAPSEGQLESGHLSRLLTHLAEETATPEEIYMLVWIGYGNLPGHIGLPVAVSSFLTGSGRKYVLFRGSIGSSLGEPQRVVLEHPPSFWWPADHSWFVVCDVDASSTYVGGSEKLIERILGDPSLEVFPADLDDPYDGHFIGSGIIEDVKTRIGRSSRLRHYLHQFRPRFGTAHGPSYSMFRSKKKRFWE